MTGSPALPVIDRPWRARGAARRAGQRERRVLRAARGRQDGDRHPLHGRNLFPRQVPRLRELVLSYLAALTHLGQSVLSGVALGKVSKVFPQLRRDVLLSSRSVEQHRGGKRFHRKCGLSTRPVDNTVRNAGVACGHGCE
jgi:hypothetical protein